MCAKRRAYAYEVPPTNDATNWLTIHELDANLVLRPQIGFTPCNVCDSGTNILEAAADLVEKLNAQLGYGDKQAAE